MKEVRNLSGSSTGDEFFADLGSGFTLGGGEVADETDELIGISGLGLDVVGKVVGVVAREGLAARERSVGVQREHLLDTINIIWVDDSRDIKVSHASPGIEADFTEHTGSVVGAFGDRVPVANPAGRERLVGSGIAGNSKGIDGSTARGRSEDQGTGGAVLVDEVHGTGRSDGSESCGSGKDGSSELHFE